MEELPEKEKLMRKKASQKVTSQELGLQIQMRVREQNSQHMETLKEEKQNQAVINAAIVQEDCEKMLKKAET